MGGAAGDGDGAGDRKRQASKNGLGDWRISHYRGVRLTYDWSDGYFAFHCIQLAPKWRQLSKLYRSGADAISADAVRSRVEKATLIHAGADSICHSIPIPIPISVTTANSANAAIPESFISYL